MNGFKWQSTAVLLVISTLVLGVSACSSTKNRVTVIPSGSSYYEVDLKDISHKVVLRDKNFDVKEAESSLKPVLLSFPKNVPAIVRVYFKDDISADTKFNINDYLLAFLPKGTKISFEKTLYVNNLVFVINDVKQEDNNWYTSRAVNQNYALSTNYNLNSQAADPKDLIKPKELGAPNPQAVVGAVDRYQTGSVRGFNEVSLDAGGSSSN